MLIPRDSEIGNIHKLLEIFPVVAILGARSLSVDQVSGQHSGESEIPDSWQRIPAQTLHRFWVMLSHYHGELLNYSELSRSLGIWDVTIRKYIDILEGTFMIRVLQPSYVHVKKRLVKRQKIYFRDSGIFHTLMSIKNENQLITHPKLGASWEGFAMDAPKRTKSMQIAMQDLELEHLSIIYPGSETYALDEKITVLPLRVAIRKLAEVE